MSGPVDRLDAPPDAEAQAPPDVPPLEVTPSRDAHIGALRVRRALPQRHRRTVGAWCFVDHMVPAPGADAAVEIGPHPHIGLQTVTWLLAGELLHRDGLGSEQLIRPGQLNLMTAGHGIAHAEESPAGTEAQHGAQLWIAQPEATRHGPPAFAHHAELPRADLDAGVATVLVGSLAGVTSPARHDTDLVGADLDLRGGGTSTVALDPRFEHALVVLDGAVTVGAARIEPGHLAHLGLGREELAVTAIDDSRVLLLGGEPFEATPLMWWNYVARTHDEVWSAHRDWSAGKDRFAPVASALPRIDSPAPPWREPPSQPTLRG